MNDVYEAMTASEIAALLDSAPFGTLSVADKDDVWAVPMFYRAARRQGTFVFTLKTAQTGTKMEMLDENPEAVFTVTQRRAGQYESVVAEGSVLVRPASCGCAGKVELELTAEAISGRRYSARPGGCRGEDPNRGRRAPEYEPQPRTAREEQSYENPQPRSYRQSEEDTRPRAARAEQSYEDLRSRDARQEAYRAPRQPQRAVRDADNRTARRPAPEEPARAPRREPEAPRVHRCESSERLDRLWHRYGEKDPECTALKLAQSTPVQLEPGAVLKDFERVRESDVASWRDKTGHIVFRKNGVYRLKVRAQATDTEKVLRPKLALWCENGSGCLVERLAFRPVDCDNAELEATLVFEVDDSHYSYTLKNAREESWQLTGVFLFEKIR